MRWPASVALMDDHRTGSPSQASTRVCTSRACIGSRSLRSTSEIASMIRPCLGCAPASAPPRTSVAHVRLRSRQALLLLDAPLSKPSRGAGGLEWCPLRSIRHTFTGGVAHFRDAASGLYVMTGAGRSRLMVAVPLDSRRGLGGREDLRQVPPLTSEVVHYLQRRRHALVEKPIGEVAVD